MCALWVECVSEEQIRQDDKMEIKIAKRKEKQNNPNNKKRKCIRVLSDNLFEY